MARRRLREPGRREENKARNRTALLRAARDVFAETGYAGATIRDIVRQTKLASGTFYQYFRDKRAIYAALEHEVETLFVRAMRGPRGDVRLPVEERVRRSFLAVFEFAEAEPEYFALFQQALLRPKKLERAMAELREDLPGSGKQDPLRAELAAAAVIGLAGTVARRLLDDPRLDREVAARLATEWVLKILT